MSRKVSSSNQTYFIDNIQRQENAAIQQCQLPINASLEASNQFSEAVLNKEHKNLRLQFETLCRKLGKMIGCVEPITRMKCGEAASQMMLRFITVGFSSFEHLYSQLGLTDQLPTACKSLISFQQKNGLNYENRQFYVSNLITDYSVVSESSSILKPCILFILIFRYL